MEEQNTHQHAPIQPEPAVSFPDPRPQRSGGSGFPKWIFAVVGLVIILAAGGFFLYQSSTSTTVNPTPSPFVSNLDTLPTPSETPFATTAPSATPASTPSTTQRTGVSVEVQNGTGTTGDAALAKSLVEKAGYTKVTTANAASQDATTTTLKYSSDVPMAVVNEIVAALAPNFGAVTPQTGLSGKMSVQVVTGPKSSASTARPSASPTASAKATTTPRASATPSASATPKASVSTSPSATPQ